MYKRLPRFAHCCVLPLTLCLGIPPLAAQTLELTEPEKRFVAETPVLRLCVDPDWLPYEGLNDKGEHVGLVAEYMREVQRRSGLQFQLVPTASWEQTLALVSERNCDVVSALNQTRDREVYLSFTDEYIVEPSVIVARVDRADIRNLDDLLDKRIAVVPGYALEEKISQDYPGIERVYVSDLRDGLTMLVEGQADATVGSQFIMETLLRDPALSDLRVVSETQYLNLVRMGIRKDYRFGYSILNRAVRSLDPADHNAIRARHEAAAAAAN